jgi:hypothetical protein
MDITNQLFEINEKLSKFCEHNAIWNELNTSSKCKYHITDFLDYADYIKQIVELFSKHTKVDSELICFNRSRNSTKEVIRSHQK